MQLFYNQQLTPQSRHLTLDQQESHHAFKVLRKKAGDTINITDGRGNLYLATVMHISRNRCDLDIAFAKAYPAQPYQLHIAIAPTKSNDRTEWFIEKATEIGVTRITPLLCDHSERKRINRDRLDRIMISAMKQSLQCHLPVLDDLMMYNDFINSELNASKYIAHCEDHFKTQLKDVVGQASSSVVLIGPEGDFSDSEIQLALSRDFKPISLGNNRLRTESAGVYTAAAFSVLG